MILYIIFPEIFLENIKQNNGIKGIVKDKKELKTTALADDTTIYIGSNSSLAHLLSYYFLLFFDFFYLFIFFRWH